MREEEKLHWAVEGEKLETRIRFSTVCTRASVAQTLTDSTADSKVTGSNPKTDTCLTTNSGHCGTNTYLTMRHSNSWNFMELAQ